ncbi:MAG: hypothetical protein V5A47_13775 [Bacteroidales bacterium]
MGLGCSYDLNVSLELGEEVGSLLYCRTKLKGERFSNTVGNGQWAVGKPEGYSWQENLSVIGSHWWSFIVIKLVSHSAGAVGNP